VPPTPETEHFFVDRDLADPALDDEIADLENDNEQPDSIMRFLTLPSHTTEKSTYQRPDCGFLKVSDFDK
jgi:hypothetical protein